MGSYTNAPETCPERSGAKPPASRGKFRVHLYRIPFKSPPKTGPGSHIYTPEALLTNPEYINLCTKKNIEGLSHLLTASSTVHCDATADSHRWSNCQNATVFWVGTTASGNDCNLSTCTSCRQQLLRLPYHK